MARPVLAILLVTAILCAAGLCASAEPSPSYERLKFLEPLVGNWKGATQEGDKIIRQNQQTNQWILNKAFMRQVGWGQGQALPFLVTFWTGWNPQTKEVFGWGIAASDGGYAIIEQSGAFDPANRVLTSRRRLVFSGGGQNESLITLKFADDGTITKDYTERNASGLALPDHRTTLTRAPAVAAPPFDATPGPGFAHLKFLDFSVGKWKLEGDLPDGRYLGEEVNEWMLDKNFIRTKGWGKAGEGKRVDYELLTGWEPAKKKVFMRFLGSDGSIATREGSYDAEKNCLKSNHTAVDASGVESSVTVVEQYINKDRFLLKFTNAVKGGKPQPDTEVTATRIGP